MDEEKRKQLGILAFTRAVCADWFTRMSGPLSVPAAFLTYWLSNDAAKILAGVTAFLCLWATAYALWRKEREEKLLVQADVGSLKSREIEAQERHAEELRRHTAALERNRPKPPMIQNLIDAQNRRERIAMGLEEDPDKPALTIKINASPAYDGDAERVGDIGVHVFLAELTGGGRSLTGCQIHLENGRGHHWVISKSFNLRPGERKVVPLIRYRKTENPQQRRAFVYMLRDDGEKTMEQAAYILGPDRYTFKVLSQEAKPVTVDAQLRNHPKSADDWTLEEVPHEAKA